MRAMKLIHLPQAEDVMKSGTTCSVAGWGLTGVHRSQKTKVLQEGDSRGPLVCNRIVQAIVSHGNVCGIPTTIYTCVLAYIPWIMRNTGEE
ncbi:PREDICTED: mast cell protease 4-like [Crocodylus porosus]|uniref:mast cell protease 4-like n=1 Tax=Crocodylus porosus TaxID=8502 RepID=UPI00093E17EB|nr:PREDICTED: mast cell protease 4-like [Crocodylus porosus]